MKIIISRATVRFSTTDQAVLHVSPSEQFRGNTIHGPICCEFKDNALRIKGRWRNPMERNVDVEVSLNLGLKTFAQAIQFALDAPHDDRASIRLPHHERAAVQDKLLQLLLPRKERPRSEIEFVLSPAKSKPSEWAVVYLTPGIRFFARVHARVQADTFGKLAR